MNIKDLKYLTAVAEHKNFRKAAEACFVSQPTLSMQLKKLEDFLQVQLIERNSRNIMLTPAGIEVCKRAKEINQLADEIINLAKNFRSSVGLVFAHEFKDELKISSVIERCIKL